MKHSHRPYRVTATMTVTREIELQLTGTLTPGCDPTLPSHGDPGDPGWPPEVEINSVKTANGKDFTLTPDEEEEAAAALLEQEPDDGPEYEREP